MLEILESDPFKHQTPKKNAIKNPKNETKTINKNIKKKAPKNSR